MRNLALFAAVLLCAAVLLAAGSDFQPMKVKTGLWQVNEISNVSGLPPEMERMMGMTSGKPRTINFQSCVTEKDLTSNPWANGQDEKCTWTLVNSSASDMEVKGTSCDAGKEQGMKTDVDLKVHALDAENVRGTTDGTSVGNGMNVQLHNTFTGKWVSASCPAGMK